MGEHGAALREVGPTFSVVVPTVGRRTLDAALRSVTVQLLPGDELFVVCNDRGDQGDWARNGAIERAIGSHLVFLDDDDEFAPDALATFRRFAIEYPSRIGLFRMRLPTGELVWREPIFESGQVGSSTMLVPNIPGCVGRWVQTEIGNDWSFIEETVRLQGQNPIFRNEIVASVRPGGTFDTRVDEWRYRLRVGSRLRRAVAARK
jgi:glycosyltransferase involved in cell wall biosynthesis